MKKEIEIMAVGDLILDRPSPMEQYFQASRAVLRKADLLIGQIETPHTSRPIPSSTDYQAPPSAPENLDVLADCGFKVATLAGNHIYDCGQYGVTDTYDKIKELGILPVGAGENISTAKSPAFFEQNGIKTGTLSYNAVGPDFSWATTQKAGCNYLKVLTHYEPQQATPGGDFPPKVYTFTDPEHLQGMKDEIEQLKQQCDIAIVALHKGSYSVDGALEMYERPLAQAAIDAGADVVICHHAHQPRGIEIYKGKPIYHGLGNFVCVTYALTPSYSDSPENDMFAEIDENFEMPEVPHYPWENESRITMIAKVVADKNGIIQMGYIPCYIEKETTAPTPKTKWDGGQKIFDHIKKMSEKTDFEWSEDGTWIVCNPK